MERCAWDDGLVEDNEGSSNLSAGRGKFAAKFELTRLNRRFVVQWKYRPRNVYEDDLFSFFFFFGGIDRDGGEFLISVVCVNV